MDELSQVVGGGVAWVFGVEEDVFVCEEESLLQKYDLRLQLVARDYCSS